jgi:hypothetical protein
MVGREQERRQDGRRRRRGHVTCKDKGREARCATQDIHQRTDVIRNERWISRCKAFQLVQGFRMYFEMTDEVPDGCGGEDFGESFDLAP